MQTDRLTWLELVGLIGEQHMEVARMYGDGILTDSELFSLVSETTAGIIKHFFHHD